MPDIDEIEVSTPSTPASIAFNNAISAIPVVEWQCKCNSTSNCFLIARTNSSAASGVKIPDISLITKESIPISKSCSVTSNQVCNV